MKASFEEQLIFICITKKRLSLSDCSVGVVFVLLYLLFYGAK
jgi:hypothetical protein